MRRRHLYRQQYRAMQGILPCTLYGYAWNIGVRMKKAKIPCIFALLLTATPALATPEQGISVYPAAFFADSRPATANDMISRLPGFTLDTGTSARGFAGTAGNVLIDGAGPSAKSDASRSFAGAHRVSTCRARLSSPISCAARMRPRRRSSISTLPIWDRVSGYL